MEVVDVATTTAPAVTRAELKALVRQIVTEALDERDTPPPARLPRREDPGSNVIDLFAWLERAVAHERTRREDGAR